MSARCLRRVARRDEGSAPRECSAPPVLLDRAAGRGTCEWLFRAEHSTGATGQTVPLRAPGLEPRGRSTCTASRASAGALMACADVRAIAFVVCKCVCFSVRVLIVAMLFCVMFSLSVCAHVCFCNSIRIGTRSGSDVCAVLLLLWSMCSRVRGALREGGCRLCTADREGWLHGSSVWTNVCVQGFTALHLAGQNGHRDCAELFLQHGAAVDAKDNTGKVVCIQSHVSRGALAVTDTATGTAPQTPAQRIQHRHARELQDK